MITTPEQVEIPVGKTGVVAGKLLRAIEHIPSSEYSDCDRCFFGKGMEHYCKKVRCIAIQREDGIDVFFQKVVDA